MPWQKNGTPNTLNLAGDVLSVDDLTEQDTSVLLCHALNSGTIDTNITFDNDTGSNYTIRQSSDGGADSTAINQSNIATGSDAADGFHVYYTVNIRDHDKLLLGDKVDLSSTGAGTAPSRRVQRGKWANTVDQFTSVEFANAGAGSFLTDSNLSVLSDVVPLPVGGWVELTRASNAALPDVTSISDKRYYMILNFQESNASNPGVGMTVNGDTGSNYATRRSINGAADTTHTSLTSFEFISNTVGVSATAPFFTVGYFANLSTKEKLMQTYNTNSRGGTGAGNDPSRMEYVGKWTNTSDAIDQMTIVNSAGGSFNTNGEIVVLGWDPTDTHTNNFWEELASVELASPASSLNSGTITTKKYLWIQTYIRSTSGSNQTFRFNSDSGSNYSFRKSSSGAADTTGVNQTNLLGALNEGTRGQFWNIFIINNASIEKLVIAHQINANATGAGNAPFRTEQVMKWDNTSNQIDEFDISIGSTWDTGSFLKIWGSN